MNWIIIMGMLFYGWFENGGMIEVIINIKKLFVTIWELLNFLNFATFTITGDNILTIYLGDYICYAIVGLILDLSNIPEGNFGKIVGKPIFWLVGFLVAFIFNLISFTIFS